MKLLTLLKVIKDYQKWLKLNLSVYEFIKLKSLIFWMLTSIFGDKNFLLY